MLPEECPDFAENNYTWSWIAADPDVIRACIHHLDVFRLVVHHDYTFVDAEPQVERWSFTWRIYRQFVLLT